MHQELVFLVSTVAYVKYHFVLTVNQTAGTLGTRKTKLLYATISLIFGYYKDTYALFCVSFNYNQTQ